MLKCKESAVSLLSGGRADVSTVVTKASDREGKAARVGNDSDREGKSIVSRGSKTECKQ